MCVMDVGKLYPVTWFKPGDDPNVEGVPGTYQVDADGRVEVHTHRLFTGQRAPIFGREIDLPPVLFGRSGGTALTLVGPKRISASGWNAEWDVTIHVDYALEGRLLADGEDLRFTSVRLRFADQDVWTDWDRFDVQIDDAKSVEGLTATLRDVPIAEAAFPGGVLRLGDASYVDENGGARSLTLQSQSYFEFDFDEPVAIAEIIDRYAFPLRMMLMSASGRLPGVLGMAGTNSAWDVSAEGETGGAHWLSVRQFHGRSEPSPAGDARYLFRLRDLDFATHIPLIFEAVDRHRFALGHYGLLCAETPVGGWHVQFSVATQLIDALDRTLHPADTRKLPFEERLRRLEDLAGNVVAETLDDAEWRRRVGRLRNDVVHGDRHAHELLADQRPVYVGFRALVLLFEVVFLTEIGLDVDRARALATEGVRHWWIKEGMELNYPALIEFDERQQARRDRLRPSR